MDYEECCEYLQKLTSIDHLIFSELRIPESQHAASLQDLAEELGWKVDFDFATKTMRIRRQALSRREKRW